MNVVIENDQQEVEPPSASTAIGLLLPEFNEFLSATIEPTSVHHGGAVDVETLREADITVLKSVATEHGTRHRIETDCGRVLWTYDLEGYAVSRLSRGIARERADLERLSDEQAASSGFSFLSKVELYAHIEKGVSEGTTTVKDAAARYRIPLATLYRHLRKAKTATIG
ncbi:hypothetical protein SAMN05446927_5273 [Caballeronia arationis]|uniref:Uncharacterized protein n=1 Tax=Caballeronia arationis TaxID=1777142 RepID=A0A7Z7N4M7_9BURK|nr:hypothetical protein [Caballeronia arationis]SOE81970.1 hypothetical protein SAMN05446927_5273 [Caballeronia arationis]